MKQTPYSLYNKQQMVDVELVPDLLTIFFHLERPKEVLTCPKPEKTGLLSLKVKALQQ